MLSSAFSLNASALQGACKRSLLKSMGVSPENQRSLPKQSWVFVRDYARNIFRFNFRNDDVCFFVWIYEMEQFKLKVGRCFALISNHLRGFDLFVTGRRPFLLSERSLSFNNVMITLTSSRPSARTVELASVLCAHTRLLHLKRVQQFERSNLFTCCF